MSFSLEACKNYAGNLDDIQVECDVLRHKGKLEAKINSLCLEIGFLQRSGKNVDKKVTEFEKTVSDISKDPNEQDKIRQYGNRLVTLGEEYYTLKNNLKVL